MEKQQHTANPLNDENTLAALCHVASLVLPIVGPLIILVLKKDESEVIDYHAREALNFQITMMIGAFVSAILSIVLIGIFTMLILIIINFICPIIAAIRAKDGERYRYLFCFRFF